MKERLSVAEFRNQVKTRHKYHVAPAEQRRYRDRTYDSRAEMERAQGLDLELREGTIRGWSPQVLIPLGPDFAVRVDFIVYGIGETWAEDTKGVETKAFAKVRQLWPRYGPLDLHLLHVKGKTTTLEIIERARLPIHWF